MEKICVGSKNPVKILAVENVVKKIWPKAKVIGIEVEHGTNVQPTNDNETIEGATKRAQLSLQKTSASLGIGLEGSTVDTKYGMFLTSWVVVIDNNGITGIGSGGRILLPEKIATQIRNGKELGPVIDEFMGEHNIKQKQGTVGVLTNNLVKRTDAFERALIYALAKFIAPDYYK
ncbi:MAG: inosine/xanthosine triphosphatase [archaeon]|nr:inosine/xanthosine triphosphatase [archaeon]